MVKIVDKGSKALARGDFDSIVEFLSGKIEDYVLDGYQSTSRFSAPAWLENFDQVTLEKRVSKEDQYFVTVGGETEIEVDTNEQFDQIDASLLGLSTDEGITAEAVFKTENGKVFTDDITINRDHGFDIPRSFPIVLQSEEPVTEATITYEVQGDTSNQGIWRSKLGGRLLEGKYRSGTEIDMGLPSPRVFERNPIVLVSIDSLPFHHHDEMEPIINALGSDAVVPDEPRTQGTWTSPSHASMFTGVHPLDHQHVRSAGHVQGSVKPIHEELTMLPELLADRGYKCSGVVSTSNLMPELGFGRGFTRFEYNRMYPPVWLQRESDAQVNVNKVIKWIQEDSNGDSSNLFYFLQLFDPHYPYVPPLPLEDVDLDAPGEYFERYHELGDDDHPISNLAGNQHIDQNLIDTLWQEELGESLIEQLKKYHRESIAYTARQVERLVEELKANNLFDDAFIIVTGDHGEEFGERGSQTHGSVNDAVIRPFMVIKPPTDSDCPIPMEVDSIDFLPTIAHEIGADVPSQCQGDAWQTEYERDFRITEQLWRTNWYQVSVEKDGVKGIFSFPVDGTRRPTAEELDDGPDYEQFYLLSDVRRRKFEMSEEGISRELRNELRRRMESFVSKPLVTDDLLNSDVRHRPDEETIEELRQLGYK